ncbi:hypothetical protein [Paenibacillus segetis]|uniref:DUF1292 domain-containing protein n=1 Tax=Paenibacillus segetis TaxID=1325360 RepID=A0ABQ1YDG5_9BACL|nr:hypothetical protein [Paenibacillus segetis]GGH22032.1 hypothetical protein GCM10008013_20260 [Paenibacillus segetis]
MKLNIINAEMNKQEDGSYIGKTVFQVDSHKANYEVTFYSKKGSDWDYSLHFAGEPGDEDQLLLVDAHIEQDDEGFDDLLDAAWNSMEEE